MKKPAPDTSLSELQAKTECHYNQFPFDFLTPEDEARIAEIQPAAFRDFVDEYLSVDTHVIEVGCGPGRATLYLTRLGHEVTAVDLSLHSVRLARRRASKARFVVGTNLQLPFSDDQFDAVVSDGVIHHTPDAKLAFNENTRILKPGGYFYLSVYRRHGYYYYLYHYVGVPIRWLERFSLGRIIIHSTLLPMYYLVHFIKSRGRRTWQGAKHFFYDYIITPQATFHSREEIEEWGGGRGLQLLRYAPKIGNTHAFVFVKI